MTTWTNLGVNAVGFVHVPRTLPTVATLLTRSVGLDWYDWTLPPAGLYFTHPMPSW